MFIYSNIIKYCECLCSSMVKVYNDFINTDYNIKWNTNRTDKTSSLISRKIWQSMNNCKQMSMSCLMFRMPCTAESNLLNFKICKILSRSLIRLLAKTMNTNRSKIRCPMMSLGSSDCSKSIESLIWWRESAGWGWTWRTTPEWCDG